MKEIIFKAIERVPGGRDLVAFKLTNEQQIEAWNQLKYYQERKRKAPSMFYQVRIRPPYRPRTTGKGSQCNRFNGGVRFLAEVTGMDFDDLKRYIKKQALSRGYPFARDDAGNVKISINDGEPIPLSEADASVEDAIILNETLNQVAAELGVNLFYEEESLTYTGEAGGKVL